MRDWKLRSQISGDVVFFRYLQQEVEASFEEVFVWDLDKTYLDTSWGSLKELWRTALEKAFQKRNVPARVLLFAHLKVVGKKPAALVLFRFILSRLRLRRSKAGFVRS